MSNRIRWVRRKEEVTEPVTDGAGNILYGSGVKKVTRYYNVLQYWAIEGGEGFWKDVPMVEEER